MFREQQKSRDDRVARFRADFALYQSTRRRDAAGDVLSDDERAAFDAAVKRLGISDREQEADLAALIRDAELGRQLDTAAPLLAERQAAERKAIGEVSRIQHQLDAAKQNLYAAAADRNQITQLQLQRARARSESARVFGDSETMLKRRNALANY